MGGSPGVLLELDNLILFGVEKKKKYMLLIFLRNGEFCFSEKSISKSVTRNGMIENCNGKVVGGDFSLPG